MTNNGLVVIKADDHRTININGNILTILPYRLYFKIIYMFIYLIWTISQLRLSNKSLMLI